MASREISSLIGDDQIENILCCSEDWLDHDYSNINVFDVQLLPEDDEDDDACGLIMPCALTAAYEIEQCSKAAQFAIDYVNGTLGRRLQLARVIKCMVQCAGPMNYYITFSAIDNSTGAIEVYEAMMCEYIPWESSKVAVVRRKADQKVDKADLVQHLAVFAVYHYNKTEGDDLKYINVTSFRRLESSYSISFKAKNMLTSDVQIYETEIVHRDPMQNSLVKTFRRSPIQWTNQDEKFHFFAIFAIHHYNETKGEQLELVQVTTCHQYAESYHIAFKARDLSTCLVEHYETEVVSTAPEYNSVVTMFEKLSTNQALEGSNISTCHKKKLQNRQSLVQDPLPLRKSMLQNQGSLVQRPSTPQKIDDRKKGTGSTKKHNKRK